MDNRRTNEIRVTQVSPFLETHAELERHLANARELRVRAVADIFAAAGRGLALPLRALGARVARWQQQLETRHALMGCSDRVLADIGMAREDIPLIAKGVERRETSLWQRWHELRARLAAAHRERRHWRRVRRELMAYDDHELDDLGIRRSDIPAVVRGAPARSRTGAMAPAGE